MSFISKLKALNYYYYDSHFLITGVKVRSWSSLFSNLIHEPHQNAIWHTMYTFNGLREAERRKDRQGWWLECVVTWHVVTRHVVYVTDRDGGQSLLLHDMLFMLQTGMVARVCCYTTCCLCYRQGGWQECVVTGRVVYVTDGEAG